MEKLYMFQMAMTEEQINFMEESIKKNLPNSKFETDDFIQDLRMAIYCADPIED